MFRLQHKYQDGVWTDIVDEDDFPRKKNAKRRAKELATSPGASIFIGMVRVVDVEKGKVVKSYSAGKRPRG